ncbi:MAG: L-rhamnose mutarotase [Lacisediminihabitans sp.]
MKRIASVIGLQPDGIAEYERLHADVWPSVIAQIRDSNITNYSIYRFGELLFSYLEYTGDDFEADMAAMAADQSTQDWWAVCMPLQVPFEQRAEGEWWMELPEIFHLD